MVLPLSLTAIYLGYRFSQVWFVIRVLAFGWPRARGWSQNVLAAVVSSRRRRSGSSGSSNGGGGSSSSSSSSK